MTQQLKFSDILNILSIGILFEFVLFLIATNIKLQGLDPKFLLKLDGALLTSLVIIVSFPCWRLISYFTEYILYPINVDRYENYQYDFTITEELADSNSISVNWLSYFNDKSKRIRLKLKAIYRRIFFTMRSSQGIDKFLIVRYLVESKAQVNNNTKKSIEQIFNLKLDEMSSMEGKQVYHLIKSYISLNNSENLNSVRYGIILKYNAGLAVVSNFLFLGFLGILIKNSFNYTNFELYTLIGSLLMSRLFGGFCHEYSKRETELMLYDFNSIVSQKNYN